MAETICIQTNPPITDSDTLNHVSEATHQQAQKIAKNNGFLKRCGISLTDSDNGQLTLNLSPEPLLRKVDPACITRIFCQVFNESLRNPANEIPPSLTRHQITLARIES